MRRSPRESRVWRYASRGLSTSTCTPGMAASARPSAASFARSEGMASIGSHWKGVHGFGTKGLIETRMRPTRARPLAARRACTFAVRSTIPATSAAVSVGRPTMK